MRNRDYALKLVNDVNALCGYSNRYSIHETPQKMALFCKQGDLDRNDSGWMTPIQMVSFLQGFLVGADSISRRSARTTSIFA